MKNILIVFLLLSSTSFLKSQEVISGYVTDSLSGERLADVHIFDPAGGKGTSSNAFGFYSLTVEQTDTILLRYSLIGYQTETITVSPGESMTIHVSLRKGVAIEELVVGAQKSAQIPGQISLPMDQLNAMPALLGEKDILRSFQLLPGVQGGKEGTAGLYVRGGSPDQNLMLLDDIPLYSVTHIGGFVSVFNPDILRSVTMYKGAFPARYGGRLSSIMDIRMKQGNRSELKGNVSVGIISGKVALEGPLFNDRTTFILSARRSLFDVFTRGYQLLFQGGDYSAGYALQDLNGKISHTLDEKNRVDLSFYHGKDQILIKQNDFSGINESPYKVKSRNDRKWGNQLLALRWNHQFSPSLFSNMTLGYTRFFYHLDMETDRIERATKNPAGKMHHYFHSDIDDLIGKMDLEYYQSGHTVRFGGGFTRHVFDPSVNGYLQDNPDQLVDTAYRSPSKTALEWSAYLSDDFRIGDRFSVHTGVHLSLFHVDGRAYPSLQPRVSFQYDLPAGIALHGSYARMTQYIHLLSSTDAGMPTDLWVPVTDRVPPQSAHQWSIGISGPVKLLKGWEGSAEVFRKSMDGLIEFKEGASFYSGEPDWQDKVEQEGRGVVQGLEVSLKNAWTARTSAIVSYTWSRNTRTFEGLNQGRSFPYLYDRRHDFSVTMNHRFGENTELAASWIFMTGNAVTLPLSKHELYVLDGGTRPFYKDAGYDYNEVHLYEERNGFRVPPYHRLDVSVQFHKDKKRGRRTWTLGLYNAYSRLNSYYLYFDHDSSGRRKLYSFALFPVIPSVSYGFEF